MDNILKYNTILIKYVILFSTLALLVVVCYRIRNKYINTEPFSQISLEKQVRLYDDYRNYIDGKYYLTSRFNKSKRDLPYIVSPKCLQHKYQECLEEKATNLDETRSGGQQLDDQSILDHNLDNYHTNYYPVGFKVASRNCHENSIDKCLTDNFSQNFF